MPAKISLHSGMGPYMGVLLQRCGVPVVCGAGSGTALTCSPRVPTPGRRAPWWCPCRALRLHQPLAHLCAYPVEASSAKERSSSAKVSASMA